MFQVKPNFTKAALQATILLALLLTLPPGWRLLAVCAAGIGLTILLQDTLWRGMRYLGHRAAHGLRRLDDGLRWAAKKSGRFLVWAGKALGRCLAWPLHWTLVAANCAAKWLTSRLWQLIRRLGQLLKTLRRPRILIAVSLMGLGFYFMPLLTLLALLLTTAGIVIRRKIVSHKVSPLFWITLFATVLAGRFLGIGLIAYLYALLYDQERLGQIFVQEVKKFLRPEVAAYLKPPGSLEISLWQKRITLRDLTLPDRFGQTLLQVPQIEIKLRRWLPMPQLARITITSPRLTITRDVGKVWNFAIWATRPQPSQPQPFSPPTKLPEIYLHDAVITAELGYLALPKPITARLDCEFLAISRHHYKIASRLDSNLLQPMSLTGEYRPKEEGLRLQCQPFQISLDSLSSFLPHDPRLAMMAMHGQVQVDGITVHGLSRKNPEIFWESKIALDRGRFDFYQGAVVIPSISGSLEFRNGKLCGISAKAYVNDGEMGIFNGRLTPDGQVYLPVYLSNFRIESRLSPMLAALTSLPIDKHWPQWQPQAMFSVHGLVKRSSRTEPWDWNLEWQLTEGQVRLRDLWLENLRVAGNCQPNLVLLHELSWLLCQGRFNMTPGAKVQFGNTPLLVRNFELNFHKLHFDRQVWKQLPEAETIWADLKPEAIASGRIYLDGNPLQRLPEIDIVCEEGKATFYEIPIPAHKARGIVRFRAPRLFLDIQGETVNGGEKVGVNGTIWPLEAPFALGYDVHVQVEGASLANPAIYQTFRQPDSQDWHYDIRSVWDELGLQDGKLDVMVHLRRQAKSHRPPKFLVQVYSRGVAARYREFPYPVKDVRGKVVIQPGKAVFSNVRARNGTGEFSISGKLDMLAQGNGVAVEVIGKNVAMDHFLRNSLPADYQSVWDDFTPQGQLDIAVHVNKEPLSKKAIWQAQVAIANAQVCYRPFPYPVANVSGNLSLAENRFIFSNIQGTHATAKVSLQGAITSQQLALEILAKQVPLDDTLFQSLPDEVRTIIAKFELSGKADGRIELLRRQPLPSAPAPSLEWKTDLEFTDLQGQYRAFPYWLEQIQGKVSLTPQTFEIVSCTGHSEGGHIKIAGGKRPGSGLNITIVGQDVAISPKLYAALSPAQQEIWDKFSPTGRADMKFSMNDEPGRDNYFLHIIPQRCSVAYAKFPCRIANIVVPPEKWTDPESGVHVTPEKTVFKNLYSDNGLTKIQLAGSFYPKDSESRVEVTVDALELPIDEELHKGLKIYFPRLVDSLAPQGMMEKLHFQLQMYEKTGEKYLQYQARAGNLQATTKPGSLVQKLAGDFEISGFAHNDRYHAQGQISNGALTLAKLEISQLHAPWKLFGDYLFLSPIHGNFYEGRLQGWLLMDTSAYNGYQGSFSVLAARPQPLFDSLSSKTADNKDNQNGSTIPAPAKALNKGTLNSALSFQGSLHNHEFFTGKGWLQIIEGNIWELPVVSSIVSLLSLSDSPDFRSEAEVKFSFAKRKLDISLLKLHSSLLSISGTGTVGFDGNLKLHLVSHLAPRLFPQIPLVDQVWNNFKKDFFDIKVTGTAESPTISVIPK